MLQEMPIENLSDRSYFPQKQVRRNGLNVALLLLYLQPYVLCGNLRYLLCTTHQRSAYTSTAHFLKALCIDDFAFATIFSRASPRIITENSEDLSIAYSSVANASSLSPSARERTKLFGAFFISAPSSSSSRWTTLSAVRLVRR